MRILILEVFEKVVKHSQIISLMYLLNQTCVFINLFDGNYFNKMMMMMMMINDDDDDDDDGDCVLRRKWRNKILNIHANLDQISKCCHSLTSFVYW